MAINDIEPLARQVADVEPKIRRRLRDTAWLACKWLGKELPRIIAAGTSGGAAVVWAAVGLHEAALLIGALLLSVAFAALAGYTLGLRKQLVDERAMRRSAFVDGKRVQQEILKRDLALDEATLALVGDPRDREAQMRLRAPVSQEFKAALRYARARLAATAAADRPQPPKARVRQAAAPVAPPDVAGVRRRLELRRSEIAKLEAQIQQLASPDAIDLAVAAEQAERSFCELRAAVHEADRVARDRRRAGRKPTASGPDIGLAVAFHPNGEGDVGQTRTLTPEQIAQGQQRADGAR